METIKNNQEKKENTNEVHSEGWPEKYVLVNTETGSVVWYESHAGAVKDMMQYGGVIINTETADPHYVKMVIDEARRRM